MARQLAWDLAWGYVTRHHPRLDQVYSRHEARELAVRTVVTLVVAILGEDRHPMLEEEVDADHSTLMWDDHPDPSQEDTDVNADDCFRALEKAMDRLKIRIRITVTLKRMLKFELLNCRRRQALWNKDRAPCWHEVDLEPLDPDPGLCWQFTDVLIREARAERQQFGSYVEFRVERRTTPRGWD